MVPAQTAEGPRTRSVPTLGPVLRPYQHEGLVASQTRYRSGVRRQLLVLPTGTGKTVVFAETIRQRRGRAVVLVHRDELVRQAVEKIRTANPDMVVGVVKAQEDETGAHVIVASVQTLAHDRRLGRLVGPFATVIVDEAHHAAAATYRKIIKALVGSETLLLGVTATPGRGDGVALKTVFDEIVYRKTLPEMICGGYLADLRAVQVSVDGLNLDQVASRNGDWSDGALGEALGDAHLPDVAAKAWHDHAAGRRGLLFTPTVALAHASADALTSSGVAAEAVDGTTAPGERRAILRRLKTGETSVVTNCGVLVEGFDEPAVDAIIIGRPTRSQGLYLQMLGRGTRPHPGKTDCLIVDLVGSASRHDLITLAGLAGVDPRAVARKGVTEALTERSFAPALAGTWAAELQSTELNLFRRRPMAWVCSGQRWILPTGTGTVSLEPASGRWSVVERTRTEPPVTVAAGLSLEWAQGTGEDVVRSRGGTMLAKADAPWRARPASEKQLHALRRMRIRVAPGLTAGAASDLISARMGQRAS